jgi:hypothetical protein
MAFTPIANQARLAAAALLKEKAHSGKGNTASFSRKPGAANRLEDKAVQRKG